MHTGGPRSQPCGRWAPPLPMTPVVGGEEEVEKSEERGMGEVVMRDADVASCRQVESSARPSGLA